MEEEGKEDIGREGRCGGSSVWLLANVNYWLRSA